MIIRLIRHLLATAAVCSVVLLSAHVAWANVSLETLPPFPAPPNTSSNWIAKDIVMNNTPMSVKEFRYRGSEEQFEAFYKQQWPGPFFNKSRRGDEFLLGYVAKPYYYSVHYKVRFGQVVGQMVVSKTTAQSHQPLRTQIPLPLGSTIKQIIHAKDSGTTSESVTVSNFLSVNGNARFMISELRHLGWQLQQGSADSPALNQHGALQLEFSKRPSLMQIILSKQQNPNDQNTQMLIHWIK